MKIETERVISVGVGAATMVLGFVFGFGSAKLNPTIVSAQGSGNWEVTVEIPDCGKGDKVGQPTHHLAILWPERSGDVATIICSDETKEAPEQIDELRILNMTSGNFIRQLDKGTEAFQMEGPVEQ